MLSFEFLAKLLSFLGVFEMNGQLLSRKKLVVKLVVLLCPVLVLWIALSPQVGLAQELTPELTHEAAQEAVESSVATTPRQIIDRLIAQPSEHDVAAVEPRRVTPLEADAVSPKEGSQLELDPGVVRVDPNMPLPRLRREGGFVIERPGRLLVLVAPDVDAKDVGDAGPEDEMWVFDFDRVSGVDDLRPMIMQKTQRLQLMQDAASRDAFLGDETEEKKRIRLMGRYTVTGQVHTHRGVNYLLPTSVVALHERWEASGPSPKPLPQVAEQEPALGDGFTSGGGAENDAELDDGFSSMSQGTPATFLQGDDPADVMDALLERPRGGAATPRDPAAAAVAEGVRQDRGRDAMVVQASRREGDYLIQRVGRVVLTGSVAMGTVLFTFDADSTHADETPVVLMPCKLREELEDVIRDAPTPQTFAVSGRVYAYRGINHVLPTAYRTVPVRDNLGD